MTAIARPPKNRMNTIWQTMNGINIPLVFFKNNSHKQQQKYYQ